MSEIKDRKFQDQTLDGEILGALEDYFGSSQVDATTRPLGLSLELNGVQVYIPSKGYVNLAIEWMER